MAETNYSPDPRITPARFYESRGLGRPEVLKDRAPTPPPNRSRPAINYTASGVMSVWNPVTQAWVVPSLS